MLDTKLQNITRWATLAASMVAIITLPMSCYQFKRSSDANARVAAVGVLQDYLKFASDHEDLADWPASKPITDRYEWFASHSLFVGETVFALMDDRAWRNSVISIIRAHEPYFRAGRFPCEDYDPKFVAFVKTQLANDSIPLQCAEP